MTKGKRHRVRRRRDFPLEAKKSDGEGLNMGHPYPFFRKRNFQEPKQSLIYIYNHKGIKKSYTLVMCNAMLLNVLF